MKNLWEGLKKIFTGEVGEDSSLKSRLEMLLTSEALHNRHNLFIEFEES